MKSAAIPIGARFGSWVVAGPFVRVKRQGSKPGSRNANYVLLYPCRCDCGTERDVRAFKLLSNSRSCGCLTASIKSANSTVHGQNRPGRRTHLYSVWSGMIERCRNPARRGWGRYGGRGIAVCTAWNDFSQFAAWANESGYSSTKQIDRIDNDAGYSPNNCRWVTLAENLRNKAETRIITAFGETKCATDWALDSRARVAPQTIVRRMQVLGWSPELAITTPRANRKNSPPFRGNHVN